MSLVWAGPVGPHSFFESNSVLPSLRAVAHKSSMPTRWYGSPEMASEGWFITDSPPFPYRVEAALIRAQDSLTSTAEMGREIAKNRTRIVGMNRGNIWSILRLICLTASLHLYLN